MSMKFPSTPQIPASAAFDAFNAICAGVSKWLEEEHKTKVTIANVEASRDTAIAGIEAQRDFLLRALDVSFDERRTAFRALFDALDAALRNADQPAVAEVLAAVTTLATTNPFTELRDHKIVIEQFRSNDPWDV
ncbi:hypothetical protein GCG21_15650 [Pseudactinotalea sp. HY160]|uniref:hypothetical protein n=1 Tax=Pseudactinotalea sp. HY160 TaxID=2654490 RepID=UPI00128E312E|nr:hypothetical protein [Pseudactinotalea sp. HY160]MPV51419.1 hypothetical protein [Pseudactinotalea sp. HY160]